MGSTLYSKRVPTREMRVMRSWKVRPKTFKSEEKAKEWAKAHKIEKYMLENLRSEASKDKKIRIVAL